MNSRLKKELMSLLASVRGSMGNKLTVVYAGQQGSKENTSCRDNPMQVVAAFIGAVSSLKNKQITTDIIEEETHKDIDTGIDIKVSSLIDTGTLQFVLQIVPYRSIKGPTPFYVYLCTPSGTVRKR